MPIILSDEDNEKKLPKKQAGTAVLFLNTKGELLIIKPNYKSGWLVPGGAADDDESPLRCDTNEIKDEIGLDIIDLQLVGVYYGHKKYGLGDSLKFIFWGGILTEHLVPQIKLQNEELEKFTFATPESAVPLLSKSLQKSISKCLETLKNKSVAYIE